MTAALTSIGFVYKWTNLINAKWYIGSHVGDPSDKYIGSGIIFRKSVKKHGLSNFKRDVLYVGTDYRSIEEWYLVLFNAAENPQSYNLTNQSCGYKNGTNHTEQHRAKIAKALIGNRNGASNKGRKISDEQKEKIRIKLTGRTSPKKGKPSGLRAWNKGQPLSSETKLKISIARKRTAKLNPRFGKDAPTYGMVPWNKGKRGSQAAWNKGLKNPYIVSDETKRKLSESTTRIWQQRRIANKGNGEVAPSRPL